MKRFTFSFVAVLLAAIAPHAAGAADAPAGGPYATFTAGAQAQRGLFTLWRKDEHVYIDLKPDQLDRVTCRLPLGHMPGAPRNRAVRRSKVDAD